MVTDLPIEQLKIWQTGNWEAKRYEYDLKPSDTVIDLGAYQGEFALKIHEKYGCEVIAVEPTSAITTLYGRPWLTIINEAAWIEDGQRQFGGSAYWTTSQIEGTQVYPCFDVNKILNREIALLKINIEGDEYELIDHIYGKLKNINNIQVQFHQIPDYKHKYLEIFDFLSHTHKQDWSVPFIWESWSKRC